MKGVSHDLVGLLSGSLHLDLDLIEEGMRHLVACEFDIFLFEEEDPNEVSQGVVFQVQYIRHPVLHFRHRDDLDGLVAVGVVLFEEMDMLEFIPEAVSHYLNIITLQQIGTLKVRQPIDLIIYTRMFKTSLKRNRAAFKSIPDRLNESTDMSQTSAPHDPDLAFQLMRTQHVNRDNDLFDMPVISPLHQVTEKVWSINRVPKNLLETVPENWQSRQPNVSPLLINDTTVPNNVANLLKDTLFAPLAKIGNRGNLCWIHLGREFFVWVRNRSEPAIKLHTEDTIIAAAYGTIRGIIWNNTTTINVFAISVYNKIKLYNFTGTMLQELNISISTNNELVNWMEVKDQGIYFGGSQGNLKLANCVNNTAIWKVFDSNRFPLLKNPQFSRLFMEKAFKQVVFTTGNLGVYCLIDKQYKNNWISRRLLWSQGMNTQKEIHYYELAKQPKLCVVVHEFRVIQILRRNYPELSSLPPTQLRIQNIYLHSERVLGLCLNSGIFVNLTNLSTIETMNPCVYINPKQPIRIYESIPVSPLHSVVLNSSLQIGSRVGQATTSFGIGNITAYSDPTYFAVINTDRSSDCVFPNAHIQAANKQKKQMTTSIISKVQTAKEEKTLSAGGKIIELGRTVSGSSFDSRFNNTVFEARRQWLYVESNDFKTISKLRLIDKTLVILKIHFQIVSNPNSTNPKNNFVLEKSLIDFINMYGVTNFCLSLLEIILNRSIAVVIPEIIYVNSFNSCLFTQQFLKKPSENHHATKYIENTEELKAFAEELFDRISRGVLAKVQTHNIFYYNLMMDNTEGKGFGSNADVMWHVYTRYFQSLFATIKDEKMEFFARERMFSCFVREKLELFRRFLIRKQEKIERVHLNMVYERPPPETGFDWFTYRQISNPGKINEISEERYPTENTSVLVRYLIPTIQKINTLVEMFERFDIRGDSNITVYLSLTNHQVATSVRKMILGRYKVGDAYLDELQRIIPEIVSMPDIVFETWANLPLSEQGRIDLKQAVNDLDEDRLETIRINYQKVPGGIEKYMELLLYRFDIIEKQMRKLDQEERYNKSKPSGTIEVVLNKAEIEGKQVKQTATKNPIKNLLQRIATDIKAFHRAQDLNLFDTLFRQIKEYSASARERQATAMVPENGKPFPRGYLQLQKIVRLIIQEKGLTELKALLPQIPRNLSGVPQLLNPVVKQSREAPFQ